MERKDLEILRKVLEQNWDDKTSFDKISDFWGEPKSVGQCYVTARVLNFRYGWALLRYKREGWNHYWNRLPDGTEVDLTSDQCGGDGIYPVDEYKGKGKEMHLKAMGEVKTLNPRLNLFMKRVWQTLPTFSSPSGVSVEAL